MIRPVGFIEVTSVFDGRKAVIRAACVDAVLDNAEERSERGLSPECRTVVCGNTSIAVSESIEEICNMIYKAEL